jgi:type VI secretion system protein ImpE
MMPKRLSIPGLRETVMNANELFKAGKLKDAIDAQLQEVKSKPADHTKRIFLFELLAFSGDIDRAKKHIELIEYPEMELMAAVTSYRRLLDSEEARRKTFKNGEPPRFFEAQPDHVHLRIEAINKLRAGDKAEAAKLVTKANQLTPSFTGKLNDKPFTSFRDADDILAGVLEVFAQGNYYWVPFDQIELVNVAAPKTPRDLLWRSARLEMPGSAGNVFLPVLYPFSHEHPDDAVKLGRMTDWKGAEGEPTLGVGMHMFLVGDDDITILEWKEAAFEPPQVPADPAAPPAS